MATAAFLGRDEPAIAVAIANHARKHCLAAP
jgi:hypothetical protein